MNNYLKNIRIEEDIMIAFYDFDNGQPETKRFKFPTQISTIKKWGEDRALELIQRDLELKAMEEQIQAELLTANLENNDSSNIG